MIKIVACHEISPNSGVGGRLPLLSEPYPAQNHIFYFFLKKDSRAASPSIHLILPLNPGFQIIH